MAALFRDAVGFGEGIDAAGVSSIAASSSLAVDDDLGREGNIRPGSVAGDVDAIGNRRSGSLCPAAPAVSRNVLILAPREVVNSRNIPPVPRFR